MNYFTKVSLKNLYVYEDIASLPDGPLDINTIDFREVPTTYIEI